MRAFPRDECRALFREPPFEFAALHLPPIVHIFAYSSNPRVAADFWSLSGSIQLFGRKATDVNSAWLGDRIDHEVRKLMRHGIEIRLPITFAAINDNHEMSMPCAFIRPHELTGRIHEDLFLAGYQNPQVLPEVLVRALNSAAWIPASLFVTGDLVEVRFEVVYISLRWLPTLHPRTRIDKVVPNIRTKLRTGKQDMASGGYWRTSPDRGDFGERFNLKSAPEESQCHQNR